MGEKLSKIICIIVQRAIGVQIQSTQPLSKQALQHVPNLG